MPKQSNNNNNNNNNSNRKIYVVSGSYIPTNDRSCDWVSGPFQSSYTRLTSHHVAGNNWCAEYQNSTHVEEYTDVALNLMSNVFSINLLRDEPYRQGVTLDMAHHAV
jgi:hypothetical protein